jgi:hypothetical protein
LDGKPLNFAVCKPQKSALRLEITLPKSEEYDELISSTKIEFLDYDTRSGNYRLRINEPGLDENSETVYQERK